MNNYASFSGFIQRFTSINEWSTKQIETSLFMQLELYSKINFHVNFELILQII